MGGCRCLRAHSHTPRPFALRTRDMRTRQLRCSLRRRGSSTMHAAPLAVIHSSTLDATLLHSAHAVPSHSSTHTGSPFPMLLAWIPLRSLPPPAATARSTSLAASAPLSAYPCTVFTVYDERQQECAARSAVTGVQRHPPTVRAPTFGFFSLTSHHLMVGVVCAVSSFFFFFAPSSVHPFHSLQSSMSPRVAGSHWT